ncbi:transcriptional repressor TCF25-domain-containing protein, partial [Jimgerdemannia flammicorona]
MYPYHVDCLLQLSEVAKHSGDWQMAGEFIERAMYAFERAFHPQFNISSGSVRLSYNRAENKAFSLAIHRHIQFLTRRGCWRTAFEFNRLLLSLDPTTDPLSALLSIDFHALKAHEHAYLLRLHAEFTPAAYSDHGAHASDRGAHAGDSLSPLPSFVYSSAYARFKQESERGAAGDAENRHEESTRLLRRAVCLFPGAVVPLFEKCGEKDRRVLDSAVWVACEADSPYLNLLIRLFVERNFALWKEPEVISWLKSTILATLPLLEDASDPTVQEGLRLRTTDYPNIPVPDNLSRHILISDHQALLHYLPPEVTSQSYHMYDPLPPPDSIGPYDDDASGRSGNGTAAGAAHDVMAMLRNLLPWGDQAAAGGRAGQLRMQPRELAEQIEAFAAARGAVNDGRVPGQFPGGDGEEGAAAATVAVAAGGGTGEGQGNRW